MKLGVIATHASFLPAQLARAPVTLGEGNTPLIKLSRLASAHKVNLDIWCKLEGANPTGSFKDRGMAVAVTAAKLKGADTVLCASTGNTSASAAAYAAAAGLRCLVLLPAGKVARGKMAQAYAHGAQAYVIKDNFDKAMAIIKQFDDSSCEIVNSINPMRIQGQKTIAFEVIAQLGQVPDLHALPVGNAGNITAHWIGYCEAAGHATKSCGFCQQDCKFSAKPTTSRRPRLLGVQASGAAPFVHGQPIDNPETVATAIRIGHPQSWQYAQHAVAESGGAVIAVSDEQLLTMQAQLASLEGVFCEPASATSVAGIISQAKAGKIAAGSKVVCTLTGHGLKDPDVISSDRELPVIEASYEQVRKLLK